MRVLLAALVLLVGQCDAESRSPATGTLPPNVVVRVGRGELRSAQLEAVSRRDALVEEWTRAARYGEHMQESRPSATAAVTRAVLFRQFMEAFDRAELERAPVTPLEIEEATKRAWLELRRPRSVRFGEILLPVRLIESDEQAKRKMGELRARILGAESTPVFADLANKAAAELGIEISTRMGPPVAADGRVVPSALGDDPNASVSEAIARAATALKEPGEKSPVIGTAAGYHLLIAHEIIPAREVPPGELPRVTLPLVAADRGQAPLEALRQTLLKEHPVTVAENRDALFQLVWRKH